MKSDHKVHRYERVTLGKKGYVVYRCNLPNCTHYIAETLAKGKTTICNRCGEEMLLDSRAMKLVKPHCASCIEFRKDNEHEKLLEMLEKDVTSVNET